MDIVLIIILIIIGFVIFCTIIGYIMEAVEKKNGNTPHSKEYTRLYSRVDTMSVSELTEIQSSLSDYFNPGLGMLGAFVHPEWTEKDRNREREKKIEGGPICGCTTYGEVADLYSAVTHRLMTIEMRE